MKRDKRLEKLVLNLTKASFKKGQLDSGAVSRSIKVLKSLSTPLAIFALTTYLNGVKREVERTTLIVETATELSRAQRQQVEKALSLKLEIKNSKFIVNPSLLGGLRVKIGDAIFDDSLSEKISQVKEALVL